MADNEEVEDTISHENEWEDSKVTENEEGGDTIPRGNDWEVVSLTASAYAAAPGPRGNESIHEDLDSTASGNEESETSRALFMSGHFVFPPSQHENLPIAPEKVDHSKGHKEDDLFSEMNLLKGGNSEEKVDEDWGIGGLDVTEEFPGISLFEDKAHMTLSTHSPDFNEPSTRHGLNVDDKEQDLFAAAKLRSFHSATVIDDSAAYGGSDVMNDLVEAPDNLIDPSFLTSQAPKSGKEDEVDDSDLPCGAWWKRGVASICAQAKETSAFWSIFVAAAVMGLVVLGQRWQQERWQILHQRWQISVGDEKSGKMLSRLKDVIVGGSRRGTYVTGASAER